MHDEHDHEHGHAHEQEPGGPPELFASPAPDPARRVLVLSPFAEGAARGNLTTAGRVAKRLARAGEDVTLGSVEELAQGALDPAPFRKRECVWVGVHVKHFARALELAGIDPALERTERPGLLLVIGGNDVYDVLGPDADAGGPAFLHQVDAITVASEHQREAVLAHGVETPVAFVPRYPDVGFAPLPLAPAVLRRFLGHARGQARVLTWCGAFRPEKRPEWIAPILRGVRAAVPDARLLLAGPPPPADDPVELELAALGGVLRVPPFPTGHAGAIGTLLARTDVVLNTSVSEGTSNFLLEAMHESVPVVAANCAGTRSWAEGHAVLFDTIDQAVAGVLHLFAHPVQRATFAHAGANLVRTLASPERERRALHAALGHAALA